MEGYAYSLEMQVRDYECDMQGHVNNSVYLNYLEHCRHQFLHRFGLDFARFVAEGFSMVVVRAELDYKHSLKSLDRFVIAVNLEQVSRLRYCFNQDIYRLPDNKLMLKARVIGTAVNEKGRPFMPDGVRDIFTTMQQG